MQVTPFGLGGAFTWTNCCCAVSGSGLDFSICCSSGCACSGCSASGRYAYEGYSLPVTGGACGCGGAVDPPPPENPDDDGPYAPSISVSFSRDTVIFENRYETSPGNWSEGSSTETILSCVVHGGPNGGQATFSFIGRERLKGEALPERVDVPAKTKAEFKIRYSGIAESASQDDVAVRGTFFENALPNGDAGQTLTSEGHLTSLRVEVLSPESVRAYECSHRRTFGVRERIDSRHFPDVDDFRLSLNSDDAVIDVANAYVYCPWTGGSYEMTFRSGDAEYAIPIAVVEPQVVCREAVWNGVRGTPGCSGQLGMNLFLYVEPSTVSFSGLYLVEIPDDSTCPHSGYFDHPDVARRGELSHNANAGAGEWVQVHGDEWTMDRVGRSTSYPEPWSSGRKEWRIPVGWGDYLKTLKGRILPSPTTQVFTVEEDGTATVSKYGHTIERRTDNKVFLDGVPQN